MPACLPACLPWGLRAFVCLYGSFYLSISLSLSLSLSMLFTVNTENNFLFLYNEYVCVCVCVCVENKVTALLSSERLQLNFITPIKCKPVT